MFEFLRQYQSTYFFFLDEPDPGGATISQPDVHTDLNVTEQAHSSTSQLPLVTNATIPPSTTDLSYLEKCLVNAPCEDLSAHCIYCAMNHYCIYGTQSTANCTVKKDLKCSVSMISHECQTDLSKQ